MVSLLSSTTDIIGVVFGGINNFVVLNKFEIVEGSLSVIGNNWCLSKYIRYFLERTMVGVLAIGLLYLRALWLLIAI